MKRKRLCLFDQKVSYAPVIIFPKNSGLKICFFLLLFLFTDLSFVYQITVLGNMNYLTTSHDQLKVQYSAVQLSSVLVNTRQTIGKRTIVLWSLFSGRGRYWWQLQKSSTNNLQILTDSQQYLWPLVPQTHLIFTSVIKNECPSVHNLRGQTGL